MANFEGLFLNFMASEAFGPLTTIPMKGLEADLRMPDSLRGQNP